MKERVAEVTDIEFYDFVHVLHDYAKPNERVDHFTQELFENIAPSERDGILDDISCKTYGYYYNGRSVNELCRKIGNTLDEDSFTKWLDNLSLDDNYWNLLYKELKKIGLKFDKKHKNRTIANYFKNLIFDRSIIKSQDNVVFKMNTANQYIDKVIKQKNKKLDPKVSKYYEYKRSNSNDNTNIYLKPKSKEASKKAPIHVVGKFDVGNATNEELYNLNHITELGPLVDYNNQPLVLPKIKESTKSINGVTIPNENFEINEVGSNLILLPRNGLKRINVNFSIKNNNITVNLNNIDLTIVPFPAKTCVTNHNRNKDYPFDFELVFNINEEQTEMTYGFSIALRKEFAYDIRTILKYYKISRLLEDQNSVVKITTPELKEPLFYKEAYGNLNFTDKDYEKIDAYIHEVEKIIYLEDTFDTRFKFDIGWFQNYSSAIDIAYAAIKHEEVSIYKQTSWTLEVGKNEFKDLKIKSNIRFEAKISSINLFDETIDIPETKLFINDASIEEITEEKEKKKLFVIGKTVYAAPSKNIEQLK